MEKIIIATLFLAGAMCCACSGGQTESEAAAWKTMEVSPSSFTLNTEYTARLSGRQVVEIRPQVSGLITDIRIGEGDNVRRGQVLFVIDQVPYRAALEEAEASVKSAEAAVATARLNLESTEALREKNIVQDYDLLSARNALASAEASLAQARAKETNARNDLSYTEVKSPVDGVAGMIGYRVGALVSSNISEPLVTVSDNSLMYAYFSLSENKMIDMVEAYGSREKFLQGMDEVELKMSNGRLYPVKGRIGAVSGIVTGGTGAVSVRADFENAGGLLTEGGSASVIIPTKMENCFVIPQSATYELQDRIFVYKVIDGKAVSSPVEVYRINNGTQYIVEDGLEDGDIIIAEGAGLVQEGAAIR